MMNTIHYLVKSEGITLPDGTVFGNETHEAFRVVSETGHPGFIVYEVFGNELVNIFSGRRANWKEMKKVLDERIAYQIGIGNKVLCGGREVTEV